MHVNHNANPPNPPNPPNPACSAAVDAKQMEMSAQAESQDAVRVVPSADGSSGKNQGPDPAENIVLAPFANGYHFPPSRSFGESTKRGAVAFAKYCMTPLGFCIVLYGLLVVAWGGMIFLLLLNAAPAMCHPDCNDIDSPRRKWIEYDSQILNALFCVTGFGLAPWRFRDFYYLLQYRVRGRSLALRRLAGIHRGWFRLAGSQKLAVDVDPGNIDKLPSDQPRDGVPYPETKIPDAPLTGMRAEPTALWKIDFVIWSNVWNTFLQCGLSGFMWGMNRYDRPAAAVGVFVALAMVVGAMGGLMMLFEGKRVKAVEGVPVSDEDLKRLAQDKELGIMHYNNIKDKEPRVKNRGEKRRREVFKRG